MERSVRAYEEARALRPGVEVGYEAFAAAWDRAKGGAAADIYLALACDRDAPGAWEALAGEYEPRLRKFLRSRGATEAEARDLVSDLPGYLREPPRDGRSRTRLGTYDASGSLFSWLAVVAIRGLNDRRRAARRDRPADLTPADLPARRAGPATPLLSEESARRFHSALVTAWEALTARERLAVLLRYREGLSGREIARLMGVGEPRVSRLLEAGLQRLRDSVRRQMPETPPGTETPDTAIWKALGDVLGTHLASLAGEGPERPESRDA